MEMEVIEKNKEANKPKQMSDKAYFTDRYFIHRGHGLTHQEALKQANLDKQLRTQEN
jgi:hypothetical protein